MSIAPNGEALPPDECRELALSDSILDDAVRELSANGTVGEVGNLRLVYLALASRLLETPLSVIIRGGSSSGKSHIVKAVLALFPTSAYLSFSSMTSRALSYIEESLTNRILVIGEISGIGDPDLIEDVKTLVSEGTIRRKTVEKDPETGSFGGRTVETSGPTGLLTTTTKNLDGELVNRTLVLKSDESPEQTGRILKAPVRRRSNTGARNLASFHVYQEWLEKGNRVVTIPFFAVIGGAIRNPPVQMRRDLPKVKTAVAAHALLHRATRKRDDEGRIVADIRGDYGPVRALLEPVLGKQAVETIPRPIRDTVEVVAGILSEGAEHTTNAQVADLMGMHTSGASRNIQGALEKGFLVNREPRSGVASQLVLGRLLPSEEGLLPTVEQVEDAMNT